MKFDVSDHVMGKSGENGGSTFLPGKHSIRNLGETFRENFRNLVSKFAPFSEISFSRRVMITEFQRVSNAALANAALVLSSKNWKKH